MAYYRIILPAPSTPAHTETQKMCVFCHCAVVLQWRNLNCEFDASVKNACTPKIVTWERDRKGKQKENTPVSAHLRDRLCKNGLDAVMNIFLQKRGKFENLAFTYGTF
jgi:hypothetical protein